MKQRTLSLHSLRYPNLVKITISMTMLSLMISWSIEYLASEIYRLG
ncbi:MAG: hypothetical protein Q8N35_02640 [Methylococcaceae bacterium]|jgi:hypothetical protein|nr:hypothetical protein [Methylococcaceae bacterium]MDZ4156879.1 hypothetical protein [Methylococcales bacterium]MDP2394073.1 hypothetical protein [Methylococcaceae bacterium]MDP3018463.1 hypothetical protein [Methylococcaceae bacterium]MDP3392133.1 hypothetical protein [Methylococcaceae bacterium]